MKKLVNDPRHVVREMLEGHAALHAGVALLADEDVIIRADIAADPAARKVAVLSGGGAGHEPAHAGYVGRGMLHAAVSGDVFTSPSTDAILAAIRAAAGPAGALLIVKNYTGDRLNFGLAAELARGEGIPVEIAIVADDVALRDTVEPARRRGIAGTVLVHKIAGAAAEAGLPLAAVAAAAREAAAAIGSMGVALGACTVPASGKPGFTLADDEIELGLGIHGEPGIRRAELLPADGLVDALLDAILAEQQAVEGTPYALLVNGLGATPPMELAIVARRALATARARGLTVARAWTGNLLTALDMPGVSLSLLPLDAERTARLDAPTDAPAWPGPGKTPGTAQLVASTRAEPPAAPPPVPGGAPLREVVLAVASALEAAEDELTELDSVAGDGDLGHSMRRAATALRALPSDAFATPSYALTRMGDALRRAIGGSSGPFAATALLRAARVVPDAPTAADWSRAMTEAVTAISALGGAVPGDRTMLDALDPAARAFAAALEGGREGDAAWREAQAASREGADRTAQMHPRLGRAAYLGARALGTRDAGAAAAAIILGAIG